MNTSNELQPAAVNFHTPSVERLVEMLMVARFNQLNFTCSVKNLPAIYREWIERFYGKGYIVPDGQPADFYCEYAICYETLLKKKRGRQAKMEEPEALAFRAENLLRVNLEPELDEAAAAVVHTAAARLAWDVERVNRAVLMASVIARASASEVVRAAHAAEACCYSCVPDWASQPARPTLVIQGSCVDFIAASVDMNIVVFNPVNLESICVTRPDYVGLGFDQVFSEEALAPVRAILKDEL